MSIPVDEQETSISFLRSENKSIIYTSDSTVMTKLDKKVENYPETWSVIELIKDRNGNVVGKRYQTDKKMISFRNEKSTRSGNPNAGEGLRRWRENQKKNSDN